MTTTAAAVTEASSERCSAAQRAHAIVGRGQAGGGADGATSPPPPDGGVVLRGHGAGEVAAIAAAAREAQWAWSRRRLGERLEVVGRFAGLLEAAEGMEVAKALCEETGKPLRQARAEVRMAASRVRQMMTTLRQLPYTLSGEAGVAPGRLGDGSCGAGGAPRRRREFVECEPIGVVASITAWNFPVVLSCDLAAPALALGSAVLSKPSERAVLVWLALGEVWRRAGLPQGLFTCIVGAAQAGQSVVAAPEVGAVFLTGSRAAGRAVLAAAAGRDVPVAVHLELGGKDAVYVHEDIATGEEAAAAAAGQERGGAAEAAAAAASAVAAGELGGRSQAVSKGGGGSGDCGAEALRRVAAAVADAAFANSGQVCCAPKVVYVAQPLALPFARLVAERAAGLRAGDPSLAVDLGPLALPGAAQRLGEVVAEALADGAVDLVHEVVRQRRGAAAGGARAAPCTAPTASSAARSARRAGASARSEDGWATWPAAAAASGGSFFAPRVLWGAPSDSRVMVEETFGPVLCVQPVSSAAEAAARMSRSRYGLTACCYSRDERVARELLGAADVGTVFWNACGEMPVGLPWSGRRWSGLGFQLGGAERFKSLLRPKSHVFAAMFASMG